MKRILNSWLIIVFVLSIFAIASALFAEFVLDLTPCKMCLKQRHPYYLIILLIILFNFFKQTRNIWLYVFIQIFLIYGLFYSIWHIGIENKILSGPASCSGTLSQTDSIQNLKQQIANQAIVNCSEITWTIGGLSAATLNSLLLLLILFFNTMFILQYFYGSKKN
jgi:disulfide bond formation protein DsbB